MKGCQDRQTQEVKGSVNLSCQKMNYDVVVVPMFPMSEKSLKWLMGGDRSVTGPL